MRIAYIHPPFETVIPVGEQTATASLIIWQNEIASRLAKQHQLVVFSKGDKGHSGRVQYGNIEYRYISSQLINLERRFTNGLSRLEQLFNYPRPKRPIFAGNWYYPLYIRLISRALSQEHWDIIHLTQFAQYAPIIRKHNPDARIVIHMHAPWLGQFERDAVHPSIAAADMLIVVSNYIAQGILRKFPELKDRVHIVHNGIDTRRFEQYAEHDSGHELMNAATEPVKDPVTATPNSIDKVQRILYVGRVSPEKGVHVLIDAFVQLADRFPNAVLEIVGGLAAVAYQFVIPMDDDQLVQDLARFYKGPWRKDNYMNALQHLIPEGLRSRVHFLGPRSQEQLKEHFRRATVCVFPSVVREAFSIAVIEGMASGVAAICTEGGGGGEIMEHEVTGMLVPRGDQEALGQAITRLLENPQLRRQYGKAAQRKVSGMFTWDEAARLLEKHYLELVYPAVKTSTIYPQDGSTETNMSTTELSSGVETNALYSPSGSNAK
ncbi:MAG: glycosyltransferase family 4 protein [Anaerolineae bacterium]|nr:glycosyltransferase family 4 protein [Anaerolineae bacterium]